MWRTFLSMALAALPRCCGAQLPLVSDGASDYSIVLSARASASEEHGARELRAFLRQMSGVDIPVTTDAKPAGGPMVLVGRSRLLDALAPDIPWDTLGDEGYVIRTCPPHLILAGSGVRGAMYACYGLLEDHLGCHWLTPDVSSIPKRKSIRLASIDETVVPAFEYRHAYNINVRDALWCVRNRTSDVHSSVTIPPGMGGQVSYRPFVHSFFTFVPPARYFSEHPEYFSEIRGVRVADHAQLCLSNPHVLDIVTQGVLGTLRRHPEVKIVSVSQNDCGGYCTCPRCRTLDQREGTPAASIIQFVNTVAERVEEEFPDAAIDTLAYQYGLKAPKTIRPRHNVIVRVCSIDACFTHPLHEGCTPETRTFLAALRDWARLTRRIYVWNYNINFTAPWQPHPNFTVLGPNARFFRDHHVRGVFEESGGTSMPKGAACGHIRAYVLAKHLWNPDCDTETAIDDFLRGYYGPAAPHIRQYMRVFRDAAAATGVHLQCHGAKGAPYLTDKGLRRAQAAFDRAETVTQGNPERLWRVRQERLGLDWLTLTRAAGPFKMSGDYMVRDVETSEEIVRVRRRFEDTLEALGRERIGAKAFDGAQRTLKTTFNFSRRIEMRDLSDERIQLKIIPELGGRVWSIVDRASGHDFARKVSPDNSRYLSAGGYEEFLQAPVRNAGRKTPFGVASDKEGRITLSAEPAEGVRMARTIRLTGGKPGFSVTSKVTNVGPEARVVSFRTHPELNIAPGPGLTLYTAGRVGRWTKHPIKPFIERRNTWFAGENLPDGAWALYAPVERRGLLVRFDPAQVEKALVYVDKDAVSTLELYSPERELKPGEALVIEATYELISAPPD